MVILVEKERFTHRAAVNKFGKSVSYKSLNNIRDVFEDVAKKRCDYGVIPIENSTEGAVTYTLDMFIDYDLKICSEISMLINHHVMVKQKGQSIERFYSNPQVFGQCRDWLHRHYPQAELVNTDSTTMAAQLASVEKNTAAIASELAADMFSLTIVHESVQDYATNMTRFLIIGHADSDRTKSDKTSIVFSLSDDVGVLHKALSPFKKYDINLTKIESRPLKKKYGSIISLSILKDTFAREVLKKLLDELKKNVLFFKILGSYPKEV